MQAYYTTALCVNFGTSYMLPYIQKQKTKRGNKNETKTKNNNTRRDYIRRITMNAMMIAMCIPNVIALYILCPEIKRDVIEYVKKFKVSKIFAAKIAPFNAPATTVGARKKP